MTFFDLLKGESVFLDANTLVYTSPRTRSSGRPAIT